MPVYEYLCEKCDHEFEREQRITDDPVKTCPKCRSRRVKRLISQTSFVLKGSGWYADGYGNKKKSGSDSDAADAKGDAKTGDSGTSSSDGDKAAASSKPDAPAKSDKKSKKKTGKAAA